MPMHQCPACHATARIPFLDNEPQALATLGWPRSPEAARAMPRHAQNWVRCALCGHVYNPSFDYRHVPYADAPNLMFNRGSGWSRVIGELVGWLADKIPARGTAVEIGYGDGSFLEALAQARGDVRVVGFDPDGTAKSVGPRVELRRAMFDPAVHLAELAPALVYARHVIEHLDDALSFLQALALEAVRADVAPLAYFEVPCIDNSLARRRTCDFYYEHASQFSTDSFRRMLELSGGEILDTGRRYGGEVIWGLVQFGLAGAVRANVADARAFHRSAASARDTIRAQLDQLVRGGRRIAIWGGTGKSAAFMQRYGLDAERFPLVVDSDRDKVGTHVPGTGQRIEFRDVLKGGAADVVIIPPQWRARDIAAEMAREGIEPAAVLVEDEGRLTELSALLAEGAI